LLLTAAVVPGPPALVADLMGSAAPELDDLRQATDAVVSQVLSDLLAASEDSSFSDSIPTQLVVVGSGQPEEFDAAGPVSFASFGRDVVVPALGRNEPRAQGGEHGVVANCDLPTPLLVARYLASRDVVAHVEHADLWASARWITTSGAEASVLGQTLRQDRTHIALILLADGAACHGPKAPRAEDPRAQAYDDAVCAALASGQLLRLNQIDADLGEVLGATGQQVWPVLLNAAGHDGIGEVLWRGAPYGVGWAVASWRPAQRRSSLTCPR